MKSTLRWSLIGVALLTADHPSGRDRVELSMRWLEENQDLYAPKAQ